jgi:YVTN family beta-propeller protein
MSAVVVALVVGAGTLVAGATPAAAGIPTYDAALTEVPSLAAPTSFALASGRLVVTDGDVVRVLSSSGALLATLDDVAGASDATASPEGTEVYVAATDSDEIVVIDPSGPSISERYDVGACPRELAVSETTVWYTFGCDLGEGGINHITRATGAVHALGSPDAGFEFAFARLGVGGGRLFAYEGALTAWPTSGGSLGTPVVNEDAGAADIDLVVDGSRVVLLGAQGDGNGYTLLGHDLVEQRTVRSAGFPLAAALTAGGSRLIMGGYDDLAIGVADTGTGELLRQARMPLASEQVPVILQAGMAVSADGSTVYALAREYTDPVRFYLVRASVEVPPPTPISVTVTGLTELGATATITVRTLPNRLVTVAMSTRTGVVKESFATNASGVLQVRAQTSYSGTVTASVPGDVGHAPAARTATFHVPAAIATSLVKGVAKRKGVTIYKKFSQTGIYAAIRPTIADRLVYATLFVQKGSHWKRMNTWTMRTRWDGLVAARVKGNRTGVVMRVMFNFRGDKDNGGATEYSGRFMVR